MAVDKIINETQGNDIIDKLDDIASNLENVAAIIPAKFGMGLATCDTAADTAAKTCTIPNFALTNGAPVSVKFTYANSASNPTLNINGTGAKPMYYKGTAMGTNVLTAGDIATFIYDTNGIYHIINIDTLAGPGAGTVTYVGATDGITTDQSSGTAIQGQGSVKLNLKSNTAYSGTVADPAVTDKVYPVALDGDGHPVVGVPWTDTTYSNESPAEGGTAVSLVTTGDKYTWNHKLDATANAASAAKLNDGSADYAVGSATKGVYFNNGVPTEMTYSVGTNVPAEAVFTDTTYSSGSGITVNSSHQINHSNSVTAKTTASALKVSYDAQGHITGSSALAASDVGAIATTAKGVANGVAELDSTGKVPSSQLPSYVDDVLEYSAKSSFPAEGETGKIYVDTSDNKTYRWGGTAYVEISPSLALGTTSSTAYYGDKGKTAYDHSQVTSGNPHNVTKTDVGLENVGNFKAVSTVASQGLSDTEKANARANIGAGTGNGTYSKPSGGIPKTDLASAVQTSLGLADTSLQHTTVSGSPDLDTYLTTGVYHITTSTATHAPTTNHATLFVDATVGTPYQIFKPDNVDSPWYTRHRSGSTWTAWVAMKFTDTTYSAATTSAAGLMSATDKSKLDGIATGAQVNSITGVKGNSEQTYRTGNVNLKASDIGAADLSHTHNYAGSSSPGGVATAAVALKIRTVRCTSPKAWITRSWSGVTKFSGDDIWTDGKNIYYSGGTTQRVLSGSSWITKSWSGLTSFSGSYVWTDGTNIYFSGSSHQYVLNGSTWSTKTWSGYTSIDGTQIWTDGANVYYSYGSKQYVLNGSTWSAKTWTGLTSFSGYNVWTDGVDIYYSSGSTQYVLNKSNSTWSTKTWSGLTNFDGTLIWTDGTNIYYSNNSAQYVLNGSTWIAISWSGLQSFLGGSTIWTDGTNIYYSNNSAQYVLNVKRSLR